MERELLKEVQCIEGALTLLRRTLEQCNEQIRLLRSTKYFLDRDNEDKANVLKIDRHCVALQETSLNLSLYHGVAPLDAGYGYIIGRNVLIGSFFSSLQQNEVQIDQ